MLFECDCLRIDQSPFKSLDFAAPLSNHVTKRFLSLYWRFRV
nr:MAG TPA: hypothetical protein [Caudoviricetes sp.]